ncbi:MAG: lipoate--protein ligase [Geobacteraceae bacterium GWC2_55_20]|nr:MAG: lipoate--protein ligase [Geobacteraceae bacterium GWC2_55_20]OGU25541.1 MAG: lipoate--protein ligase [Geobacteraceae bacterium GWF2_54_21]HBA72165.1 lipoate--protein ligase family protein [Geobacter sp.]HCE68040.1 lipoate--protein ligase family protein [Geobacter sp.]
MHDTEYWRLIDTGTLSGPENMALDEALLCAFDQYSKPILRLYGWHPAAISLGRFQKAREVLDTGRCLADGTTIVRRITGGGVIYHADELTYSIICSPEQIPETNSIKDSFRVLTGFLLRFYRDLGLDASYAVDGNNSGEKLGERTPFCFAGKETYDILVNGRKIGGNAQRRLKRIIFQHGSIPILSRVAEGIACLRHRPENLAGRVTCLAAEGVLQDTDYLKTVLKNAFCGNLDTVLKVADPEEYELGLAGRLLHEKYLNENWNLNGEGD